MDKLDAVAPAQEQEKQSGTFLKDHLKRELVSVLGVGANSDLVGRVLASTMEFIESDQFSLSVVAKLMAGLDPITFNNGVKELRNNLTDMVLFSFVAERADVDDVDIARFCGEAVSKALAFKLAEAMFSEDLKLSGVGLGLVSKPFVSAADVSKAVQAAGEGLLPEEQAQLDELGKLLSFLLETEPALVSDLRELIASSAALPAPSSALPSAETTAESSNSDNYYVSPEHIAKKELAVLLESEWMGSKGREPTALERGKLMNVAGLFQLAGVTSLEAKGVATVSATELAGLMRSMAVGTAKRHLKDLDVDDELLDKFLEHGAERSMIFAASKAPAPKAVLPDWEVMGIAPRHDPNFQTQKAKESLWLLIEPEWVASSGREPTVLERGLLKRLADKLLDAGISCLSTHKDYFYLKAQELSEMMRPMVAWSGRIQLEGLGIEEGLLDRLVKLGAETSKKMEFILLDTWQAHLARDRYSEFTREIESGREVPLER